ncbi:MAG TPA: hypothetical protein VGF48_09775 [Thermoanaerobaculia bacterium]
MATIKPYGLAISNAIERGDARRLEALVGQARTLHEQQGGDLSKAIKAGESALKKLSKSSAGAARAAAGGVSSGGKKAAGRK